MDRTEALQVLEIGREPQDTSEMSPATHEQMMACTKCFLAGCVPDEHFPQTPGLWDRPCPKCGENAVWVTAVRTRSVAEAPNGATRELKP